MCFSFNDAGDRLAFMTASMFTSSYLIGDEHADSDWQQVTVAFAC